jgi:hypothetical protein
VAHSQISAVLDDGLALRPLPRFEHDSQRSKRMGLFTKDIKSMRDLFVDGLQDVYYAENQIVKSLPTMIEKATNRELAALLSLAARRRSSITRFHVTAH